MANNITNRILKKAREEKSTPVSNNMMDGDFILPNPSANKHQKTELINKTLDDFSNNIHADKLHLEIFAQDTVSKGQAVYASGFDPGNNLVKVKLADHDDVAKMPSLGIMNEDVAAESTGECIVYGIVRDTDTSSWNVGDTVWVGSTPGVLENSRPLHAADNVQAVAKVLRKHATSGVLLVQGAGRTNDMPNRVADGDGLPYGSMYLNSTITVTISDNNPTEVNDASSPTFTEGQTHNTVFNDHFISVDVAGKYKIDWGMSFAMGTVGGNIEIHGGIMVNGTAQDNQGEAHRTITGANQSGDMGSNVILDLAADDEVSLYLINATNTNDVNVEHANLTITQVGA